MSGNTCSVVSSLLPMYSTRNKTEEKEMNAITRLIAEILLRATNALAQKNYKAFDANPGDGACQNQALELRRIAILDLSGECQELKETALKLKELLCKHQDPSHLLKSIQVSKEMEYLLHCFALAFTRIPYKTLETGVVLTRTEPGRLNKLSKKLKGAKPIADNLQVQLSQLNMQTMRSHASLLGENEVTMLSKEHTHQYTPDKRFAPKTHGSLFYCVKTVLYRLREEKALITLKSIVPKGETSFHLLMQPIKKGGSFELLFNTKLASDTLLVVFEAVMLVSREKVAEQIELRGFTDLVLTCASKEDPYEPGSDLSTVKFEPARMEIESFREKTCCFRLDHIYLTTVKAEGVNDETA